MQAAIFFLFLVNFKFNAGAAPNFLKEPSFKSALKGSQIIFECQIDVSQPSYHWFKDGNNITKGSVSLAESVSTLSVNNLEFSDAGNYSCVAIDNQSGKRGERIGELAVKGKPTILQAPSVLSTYIGQSGMFHCVVVGDPKPTVHWKNSSGIIITSGGRFDVFSNNSLKISNLLKSDDGSFFTCEAENSYGKTAASTTLYVNNPPTHPSFTRMPVNQTVKEGERVTFYCAATGSPFPTIRWSKLGGVIPADRREEPSPGSLRIVNLQPGDDGIYICAAQNFLSSISAQAFLRIQGYPRVIRGPSNKVVTENSSVLFHCIIEGDPAPHVEWTTPSGTILTLLSQPSGAIRVLSNNCLSITMVTEMDAGIYTCAAVNLIGQQLASATLTVLTPPRFSIQLRNRTQNINSQLVVECGVNVLPVPEYHWSFNGSVITRQRSLNISSVSRADQGFYTCIANNSLGLVQGGFYLIIQVPPVFMESPKNQTIPKGHTTSFPCSASGDPTPSITWYKSHDLIISNAHYNILPNQTLVVIGVTEQDRGLFTCRAVNEAGTREAKAYLLVVDFPAFTTVPINATVEVGHSITLPCRARGPDKPHITWMIVDSSGMRINIVTGVDTQVDPNGDLKYLNAKSKDRGMHICKACNTAGCKTAKAFLDILFAPRFPVSPAPVFVLKGHTAVLECRPESNPPAAIKWMKNGQSLSGTGHQYIVNDVQQADEGSYTCKAKNSRGSTQEKVQLSIGTKAEITDFKETPWQNSKVLLRCNVNGIPSPEVTWYLQNSKLPDKQNYPDYDVTASKELLVPTASLASSSFLCNCTNPLNSVAKFARIPEAPSQVTITKIMETSLHVTWSQSNPLTLVLQYMVQVKSATGDWEPVNDTIQGTSVLVNDLDSFTAYMFRVMAANGLGTSNYSQPLQSATTLEGAPSTPRELELTAKNASIIKMSWVKPAVLNGYLSNIMYRINYTPNNGNVSAHLFIQHSSSGSPQNFTLQGLSPDMVYSVRVYAGRRRNDGVERWSGHVSKTVKTWQIVPLTPPVALTVQSNGAYQIMVKWKIPSYSIAGYDVWYKQSEIVAAYEQVRLPSMSHTVHLILDLEPDTKYEVKARMYSNAGIGPFSEPQVVSTDVDAFAVSSKLSGKEQSSGLQVAIICLLIGFLLLLVIIAFVCIKQRRSSRSRQSFFIENQREDPSLKYVVHNRDRRGESNATNGSTSDDSDGSMEGTYNFAVADDEIDEQMFAGDTNSASVSYAHDPRPRYLDPAALNHDIPLSSGSEGDAIRLENFQPRGSPMASRKNTITVYASLGFSPGGERDSERIDVGKGDLERAYVDESITPTKKQNQDLDSLYKDSVSSDEENEPPDWTPPPPPIKASEPPECPRVDNNRKDRRTSPEHLDKGAAEKVAVGRLATGPTSNEASSLEEDESYIRLAVKGSEPPLNAQVDPLKKKNPVVSQDSPENTKNGLLTNGSFYDADTSEDDSIIWPPPPPPPQNLSNPPDDSDWERPLPSDIMALPGKRNRFAAWADDESDNPNGYESY